MRVAGVEAPEDAGPAVGAAAGLVVGAVEEEFVERAAALAVGGLRRGERALEREHQRVFSAALTIRRLGEALTQPRLPDKGDCMTFDFSLPASSYLEEDLSRLDRICR